MRLSPQDGARTPGQGPIYGVVHVVYMWQSGEEPSPVSGVLPSHFRRTHCSVLFSMLTDAGWLIYLTTLASEAGQCDQKQQFGCERFGMVEITHVATGCFGKARRLLGFNAELLQKALIGQQTCWLSLLRIF